MSGGYDNNTHCYYFIDKDQEHIVNTNEEIRENTNLYDIEILTASTYFLDRLWQHKDAKSIKKIYVHNNEVFNTIENLILHFI